MNNQQIVDRATIKKLSQKSDGPALLKLAIQFAIFIICLIVLATVEMPWYALIPMILLFSFLLFALYAPYHETTHGTAFKSKLLNDSVAWLTGFFYGYSPGMHKGFHFAHHQHTNEEEDPEKGFSLPDNIPGRLYLQIFVAGFLGALVPLHSIFLSFIPVEKWDQFEASWAPKGLRKKLIWECRIMALLWIGTFVILSYNIQLMVYLLISLVIARMIHGIIVVSEHEGLGADGHMFNRTRTVFANPVFRWFWWNMNFHAEHHAWPNIPYHQLPELHRITVEKQVHFEQRYVDVFLKNK